ncbi:hypothetical protein [Nesterenkonia aurantiaca]|uniref:5,10-methylene-tetrahydrofolate dehydrogenase n=1 Tax=Nesterenkonia aurantiaca TaxID=1436010 RepID=A0A4R7FZD7_9MICC|nr:hypothetical protein [Nesterenkonia aurantiaca]TDS84259.1 hypothetical protein EV640_108118 [Nesterenkonia aurantiaca]
MSSSDTPIRVMLVADPGVAARRIEKIKEAFLAEARDIFVDDVTVEMEIRSPRITPEGSLDIEALRELDADHLDADAVLMLTEVPRHVEGRPLVAEILAKNRTAVVSYPTLGVRSTKRRIREIFMDCLLRLLPDCHGPLQKEYRQRWTRWQPVEPSGRHRLFAHPGTGEVRTLLGMTVANDPFRTAPKLSGALAGAAAVGAFGIFYYSIWEMADALSTARLLSIGGAVILSMVAWLIFTNRLWDKPTNKDLARVFWLYNGSTVLTLLIAVSMLYVALVVTILIGALVVIDPDFLADLIGSEISFFNYLDIAWLSAAMGVVAGAVGSTFDSSMDIRRITHGQRESQRRYSEDELE